MKSKTITLKVTNSQDFAENVLDVMYSIGDKGADSIRILRHKIEDELKIKFEDVTDEKLLNKTITATKATAELWNETFVRIRKMNDIIKNVVNLGYDEKENTECRRAEETQIPCGCPEA